jgi:hypothetical protein
MMDEIISTRATSRNSGIGEDIELRSNTGTRLVFRPEVVKNPHEIEASVRGTFIFQKKKTSGLWYDYKTLDLSKLKDSEWIKLELHAAELQTLITKLDSYYGIYKKYGIKPGKTHFIATPKNIAEAVENLLGNLQNLTVEDLKRLSFITNLGGLKKVVQTLNDHARDGDEEFWQKFLTQYSWVIAQIFCFPVVLVKDKAYVGGKTIRNTGGNIVDFLYRNHFSEDVLIVEIKTPMTRILGGSYRNVFSLSSDLSGAVNQAFLYKQQLQENYKALQTDEVRFNAFDPKCILIVGSMSELADAEKKRSFTLFRNDSRNLWIVTYDELLQKIKMLIRLLEGQ